MEGIGAGLESMFRCLVAFAFAAVGLFVAVIVLSVCLFTRPAHASEAQSAKGVGEDWAYTKIDCWGHGDQTIRYHAETAAMYFGLPRYLLAGMAEIESGWNPYAVTEFDRGDVSGTARGLMQIANAEDWHPYMAGKEFDACTSLKYVGWLIRSRVGDDGDPRYQTLREFLAWYSGGATNYYEKVMTAAARYGSASG